MYIRVIPTSPWVWSDGWMSLTEHACVQKFIRYNAGDNAIERTTLYFEQTLPLAQSRANDHLAISVWGRLQTLDSDV